MSRIDRWIAYLTALFCVDRLLKVAAVAHFFRRPPPAAPARWPSVTVLQPITRGVADLAFNLTRRIELDYPAHIQQLWVCDQHDAASQTICQTLLDQHPQADIQIILVAATHGALASKIEKLQAVLPHARGEIVCFVDDDVALRPDAPRVLVTHLELPRAGAVFGLACYTNWHTLWASAMSGFVNANALASYIPVTYLTEPFTITGHCFALRHAIFDAVGGLEGMVGRIDDDHELARRLRRHDLRSIQTPMIYDVANDLPDLRSYFAQMQRWFVMPRLLMLPSLSRREQLVTIVGSAGTLLPSIVALLALYTRSRAAWRGLALILAVFVAAYLHGERRYLGRTTPWHRLALLPTIAVITPLQIVWGLLAGNEIEWRGQRLRIGRDGIIEVV